LINHLSCIFTWELRTSGRFTPTNVGYIDLVQPGELNYSLQGTITYPHLGKLGTSSSNMPLFWGDMLVPWRVSAKVEGKIER